MEYVNNFRGNIPEPLNKVLEPVSVLHLDMPDDIIEEDPVDNKKPFMRHGSVGTMEDPGVIGPVVWNIYKQRMERGMQMRTE